MQSLSVRLLGHGLVIATVLSILLLSISNPPKVHAQQCFDISGSLPISGPGTYDVLVYYNWPGSGAYWIGNINFSHSGAPSGVSVGLSQNVVPFQFPGRVGSSNVISIDVRISFDTSFTSSPRDFTLTVTAVASATQTRGPTCSQAEVRTTFSYKAPSAPLSFGLSVTPASRTVIQGEYTDFDVAIEGAMGGKLPEGKSVTLKVGDLPADSFAAFYSYRGAPSGVITSSFQVDNSNLKPVFTITTKPTTPLGVYPVTITATGGGTTRAATVTLTVVQPGTFDVSVFPSSP